MNRRLMTILVVALLVATGASYLVYRTVAARMAGAATPATSQVVVAARDLVVGTVIQDADLGTAQWVGSLPKGVVARKEDAKARGVISTVYAGEPIMESRLAKPGAGGGMASIIPQGMRACAVKVDEVVGVAGFVVPGMRVDVLITGNPPGGQATTEGPRVKTILQNVEVLSAGQNIQKDAEGKPVQVQVVNLLVTPDQAEILSLASNETRIKLVLRNPLDTEVAKTSGSSMSGLFFEGKPAPKAQAPAAASQAKRVVAAVKPPPAPAAPLPPGQYVIEIINGPRKDQAKFEKAPQEVKP